MLAGISGALQAPKRHAAGEQFHVLQQKVGYRCLLALSSSETPCKIFSNLKTCSEGAAITSFGRKQLCTQVVTSWYLSRVIGGFSWLHTFADCHSLSRS